METQKKGNGSTALTVIDHTPKPTAYDPRNSEEAYRMAQHFAASKLLPGLTSPDQVFLIMATGAELQIPATAALRGVYIVQGRPFVSADLMKSLCLRRRDVCEFFRLVKSDAKEATYTAKRVGDEPVTMTFTMEQANRAKLTKADSAWATYPETMLRHRCVAQLAREVFPDLVMGIYVPEEQPEIEAQVREVVAERIETSGTDDLEDRIAAFAARIEGAESKDDLKAVVAEIANDPASQVIKERLGDAYNAKKAALK